ncbi:tRNA/rRNA methyltransferase (SpoU) [Rhodopirellula maiorica SM1]|uniref:tRNA/rRNA methyltransferase (SpoU) n=1 Tax=Rhodopirellula maiorica SM1 TaxID=1265738 RepID=M5R8H6_9BACT|nr:TrmH family RNA methyltransferase [Rhodopirellula maiorica]EMI15690.1 tRNA/rRNA methyltransferase (SpoU) [Rhodopirellula maiorica SM1]
MSDSEPLVLRSPANPTVRRLIRLRDNRTRRREKRLLVDGWRETLQAIDAGLELVGLYLPESSPTDPKDHDSGDRSRHDRDLSATPLPANQETANHDPRVRIVIEKAKTSQTIRVVSDTIMARIAYGESPRGVVSEFVQPDHSLDDLTLPANALLLVLDSLEKPGNIGAVFRCADAAGVDAVILSGGGSDIYNPNAIRSSLGTVFQIPTAVGSESEVARYLSDHKIRPLAARVESSNELWATDFSGSIAVIVGNEAQGLGSRWQRDGDGNTIAGVRIPMFGKVDSLNVSVSAAVVLFEARRHRARS